MGNLKRGRCSVEVGPHWRRHITKVPHGFTAIGEVTVGKHVGALLLHDDSGNYVLAKRGQIHEPLLVHKVEAAIGGGGSCETSLRPQSVLVPA